MDELVTYKATSELNQSTHSVASYNSSVEYLPGFRKPLDAVSTTIVTTVHFIFRSMGVTS
jgi:hypothetical protein